MTNSFGDIREGHLEVLTDVIFWVHFSRAKYFTNIDLPYISRISKAWRIWLWALFFTFVKKWLYWPWPWPQGQDFSSKGPNFVRFYFWIWKINLFDIRKCNKIFDYHFPSYYKKITKILLVGLFYIIGHTCTI